MTMTALPANAEAFLTDAEKHLAQQHRFDRVQRTGTRLEAHATETPEDCYFCVEVDDDGTWLTWASTDRYLSQSIEAELMFTGDDIDDMVDEEIVDAGWEFGVLAPNEHCRDEEMRFVFRWKTAIAPADLDASAHAETFAMALAGMVEAFVELGDMTPDDED